MLAGAEIAGRILKRRHLKRREIPKRWTHGPSRCVPERGHGEKGMNPARRTEDEGAEYRHCGQWMEGADPQKWTSGIFKNKGI